MDTSVSRWCQSIYDINVYRFEECLLKNNLSALIISGFPKPEELDKAWKNILSEYTEMIGTAEYKLFLSVYKEYEMVKGDYESIMFLVKALRMCYSKYLADELNGILRITCRFNYKDQKSYQAEVDKCERRAAGVKLRVDLKKIEYESLSSKINKETGEKQIDKNYFTSILITLSRHNQYRITKDIFVNEYCEYLKQLVAYNDHYERMMKKR